jgi:hypothetical protein
MAGAKKTSNLRYRAPNVMWFLPMRSRQREELILLTYTGGDGRWSSSPRDGSGSGGDDWWSSYKQRLSARHSGEVG